MTGRCEDHPFLGLKLAIWECFVFEIFRWTFLGFDDSGSTFLRVDIRRPTYLRILIVMSHKLYLFGLLIETILLSRLSGAW